MNFLWTDPPQLHSSGLWLDGDAHLTKMWWMPFQVAVTWLILLLEHRLSHTSDVSDHVRCHLDVLALISGWGI